MERCSAKLAQIKIDGFLKEQPITFLSNSASLESNVSNILEVNTLKQTLTKVLAVVNRVNDEIVLSIETHTDDTGTKKHNLELSQERADRLKAYFLKRTELPHIMAIGYGESLPLKREKNNKDSNTSDRRVEIILKRIQE